MADIMSSERDLRRGWFCKVLIMSGLWACVCGRYPSRTGVPATM